MKGIIYQTIVVLILIFILVGYKFTLNPFKFKINSWWEFYAWISIISGIIIISYTQSRNEYKRGYDQAINDANEYLKEYHKLKK
jgi:hypothetical protein